MGDRFVTWDPSVAAFVRLTVDGCGRVLASLDLTPSDKRAAIRHVMRGATRDQGAAFVAFLDTIGLSIQGEAYRLRTREEWDRAFVNAAVRSDLIAFIERLEVEMKVFLMLVWAASFACASPGQHLAALEDLDADLAYAPPHGAEAPRYPIDGGAILAALEPGEQPRCRMPSV